LCLQQFIRGVHHARQAAAWLSRNISIFSGTVHEPVILRHDISYIKDQMDRQIAYGATYDELRDYLLFDFDNSNDVQLFLNVVRESMNLSVNVSLLGKEYIENNTKQW
jgi:hypothetical protein